MFVCVCVGGWVWLCLLQFSAVTIKSTFEKELSNQHSRRWSIRHCTLAVSWVVDAVFKSPVCAQDIKYRSYTNASAVGFNHQNHLEK